MDQITRINKYEHILDKSENMLNKIDKYLNDYSNIQKEIKELNKYYGSESWYQDVDSFDMKLLPKDIKAGILSEDSIYNLLMNNKEIAIKMLELATKVLKNN